MYFTTLSLIVMASAHGLVQGTTITAKTSSELLSALDSASPGDTIKLLPIDYTGDFTMYKAGNSGNPITIKGTSTDGRSTKIIGTNTAFTLTGANLILSAMQIVSARNGVIVQGPNSRVDTLVVSDVDTALQIQADDCTVHSLSIMRVKDGIIAEGNRANINTNSVLASDRALVVKATSCCGVIDKNSFSKGKVVLEGNKYKLDTNVASKGLVVNGCDNVFGGNVAYDTQFTKSCQNPLRGGNVFNGSPSYSSSASGFAPSGLGIDLNLNNYLDSIYSQFRQWF